MDDLSRNQDSMTVKIMGNDADGNETHPIGSTSNNEVRSYDVANSGGVDTVVTIVAAEVIELKVGALTKEERKFIMIQAKSKGLTWGFSLTTQSFDCFKNQLLILPFGPNTSVYIKNNEIIDGSIAIGEA